MRANLAASASFMMRESLLSEVEESNSRFRSAKCQAFLAVRIKARSHGGIRQTGMKRSQKTQIYNFKCKRPATPPSDLLQIKDPNANGDSIFSLTNYMETPYNSKKSHLYLD